MPGLRRSTARLVGVGDRNTRKGSSVLPVAAYRLIDPTDPALPHIAGAVIARRDAGADMCDPEVIEQCIAAGRLAHAADQLGGAA